MTGDSRRLALRIHVPDADVTKTLVFDALMTVGQACDQIRQQIREIDGLDNPKDYGLFLPHEDSKKGLWLDHSRSLEHYILRNGDTVEYKYRYRWLYIRTMDGTRKTLRVDDSKTLSELMLPICTKMGIYNYEEYLLVRDVDEAEKDRTMTLRKSHQTGMSGTLRDAEKMDKLRRELHTDDDVTWLNPSQSLRQQGIGEKEILLLRRRYFFSDMNVDARDPVQLNLLYVQLTMLLQEMWYQGYVPQDFKDATIVHLYKKKKKGQLFENNRGISLLSIARKIFTHILFNRFNGHLKRRLFPESQCGLC
ncbi:unnamed protein product [Schistocephalus solidus]|uniref:FERM domain-containing protein n=1 Tax=Schistocephalus solidus TaxID=70667 RepID=A0A183SDS1_SCHSO|nr:unnamed protein product [Schistocephalus solidus]